eukprot:TRINITY_DN14985_c0_g2_i1.p1 TRINITY_DN14985_c0_g2~~TRINITY_DN14985_c0_g2_i1.p1  ORF type:complete len:209 (-),score=51.63 TRINITY_DN14985_c0_g2_i1:143-769(-)
MFSVRSARARLTMPTSAPRFRLSTKRSSTGTSQVKKNEVKKKATTTTKSSGMTNNKTTTSDNKTTTSDNKTNVNKLTTDVVVRYRKNVFANFVTESQEEADRARQRKERDKQKRRRKKEGYDDSDFVYDSFEGIPKGRMHGIRDIYELDVGQGKTDTLATGARGLKKLPVFDPLGRGINLSPSIVHYEIPQKEPSKKNKKKTITETED